MSTAGRCIDNSLDRSPHISRLVLSTNRLMITLRDSTCLKRLTRSLSINGTPQSLVVHALFFIILDVVMGTLLPATKRTSPTCLQKGGRNAPGCLLVRSWEVRSGSTHMTRCLRLPSEGHRTTPRYPLFHCSARNIFFSICYRQSSIWTLIAENRGAQ